MQSSTIASHRIMVSLPTKQGPIHSFSCVYASTKLSAVKASRDTQVCTVRLKISGFDVQTAEEGGREWKFLTSVHRQPTLILHETGCSACSNVWRRNKQQTAAANWGTDSRTEHLEGGLIWKGSFTVTDKAKTASSHCESLYSSSLFWLWFPDLSCNLC